MVVPQRLHFTFVKEGGFGQLVVSGSTGIALEVEVECFAAGHGVTFCLTCAGIIAFEVVVGQVIAGAGGALEGYE